MTTVRIVTLATATIRETWTYTVAADVAAALIADPERALDLLADNELTGTLVSEVDEVIGNEEDREVQDVTEVSE